MRTSIEQSHLEHRVWMNELEFYREEMTIFENHLAEVANKNTGEEPSLKADEFRNQFLRFKQRIDELEYEINEAEQNLAIYLKEDTTIDYNQVNVGDQQKMRDEINDFKRDYRELKNRFMQYEEEWM